MNNSTQNKDGDKDISIGLPKDFVDLYYHAKEAILFFETHEEKKAAEVITEFRDALDHLMLAFEHSNDKERSFAEKTCALEHLRRGAIEPYEHAVENILADIRDKYNKIRWYRLFLIPIPTRESYYGLFIDVKNELLEGRICKNFENWKEGIEHFKRAYTISTELERLFPEKSILYGRIFSTAISFGIALVFFILGRITS